MNIIIPVILNLYALKTIIADFNNECSGILFDQVYHDKETIVEGINKANNLIYHKESDLLFFSHTVGNETHVDFQIVVCQVQRRKCENVKGINGGYAIAYDHGNDDIYFGGHDGIFRYNFLSKSADYFSEEGVSIWGLFIRKNFYYIAYPSQRLHVYEDDHFLPVPEAANIEIDHFYISKYKDIYFSNRVGLYKIELVTRSPIMLNDEITVRQITEDRFGDVIYFCASDGIYIEDKPYHRVKKVAQINNAFGLALDDKDNVIYSDDRGIYKLTENRDSLCLYH